MPEPIIVPCEGSGARGHRAVCPPDYVLCPMCGGVMRIAVDGNMPAHDRQDILAMVQRGDFDG